MQVKSIILNAFYRFARLQNQTPSDGFKYDYPVRILNGASLRSAIQPTCILNLFRSGKIKSNAMNTKNKFISFTLMFMFLSLNVFAQDTKVLLEEAKTIFEAQKFDEAIAKLNPIIARDPSNEEALTYRARAFIILKKVPEAAGDADKVLAMNPKNTFALNVRGMVKGANKDFSGAIADFTQAVSIDPKFFRAFYQRARAKMFLKMSVNEVLADFDAYLKFAEEPSVLADAGYYCTENGGAYQTCAAYFAKIKANNPSSAAGYFGYALAYGNAFTQISDKSVFKGEIVENFRKAMALDPKMEGAPLELGRLLLNLDDYENAITAFNQALAINPKRAWTYGLRADSYRLKKDYDKAIEDYSKAIELDPNYKWAYQYRGKTRVQKVEDPNRKGAPELEYYVATANDFKKWIELSGVDYEAYKDFDRYNLPLFDKKGFYKKLFASDPKNSCAGYYMALETGMGKIDEWKSIIDNYDGSNGAKCASGAALQLGRIYADGADGYQKFQPDYAKAEQYYNLAAKFDPSARANADNWITRLPKELKGTPVTVDSRSAGSSQRSKASAADNQRVERAVDAYETAHEKVEFQVRIYVDASNALNKAGQGAFLMKSTQAKRYRAQESAINLIEELLNSHGKYLPKDLLEHILEDYDLIGGVRNYDYLLNN